MAVAEHTEVQWAAAMRRRLQALGLCTAVGQQHPITAQTAEGRRGAHPADRGEGPQRSSLHSEGGLTLSELLTREFVHGKDVK